MVTESTSKYYSNACEALFLHHSHSGMCTKDNATSSAGGPRNFLSQQKGSAPQQARAYGKRSIL